MVTSRNTQNYKTSLNTPKKLDLSTKIMLGAGAIVIAGLISLAIINFSKKVRYENFAEANGITLEKIKTNESLTCPDHKKGFILIGKDKNNHTKEINVCSDFQEVIAA